MVRSVAFWTRSPYANWLRETGATGVALSYDYKRALARVRRYATGFDAASGYDARKPLNFGRRMAIHKYAKKLDELLAHPVEFYTPKKKERREVFAETGQQRMPRFKVAIVQKPPTPAKFKIKYDVTRPRGSRLVAEDRETHQEYFHISGEVFLDYDYLADDLAATEAYAQIIEEYAPNAEFFLIQAGESYMWGSALGSGGSRTGVADKISQIFRNYSSDMFDANNKNSSYYGNWFRGVTAFTSRYTAVPAIAAGIKKQAEYRAKYKTTEEKYRMLKDGSIGVFKDGRLIKRAYLDK